MKKKNFKLRGSTDIKVFMLFLLEYIRHPVDKPTLLDIVSASTEELTIDYDECIGELIESGHIFVDEAEGEEYFIITDSGKMVAGELFDTIDPEFRERSLKEAIKHLSLERRGAKPVTKIEPTEGTRYKVTLSLVDIEGEIFTASFTVSSLSEAEKIRAHFQRNPESVYRGVFFSATGRFEYLA